MAKKEEHKEELNDVEEEESEFDADEEAVYNKEMMILDDTANNLIHKIEALDVNDKKNWDELKELSKILKNIASAKKNLLKADLLSLELDDCLYDDIDEDESKTEEAPIEFEDEEIEEVEEPETKKDSKKHK